MGRRPAWICGNGKQIVTGRWRTVSEIGQTVLRYTVANKIVQGPGNGSGYNSSVGAWEGTRLFLSLKECLVDVAVVGEEFSPDLPLA